MKKNKYSIIVPVYNVEKLLNKCIDSILEQTYDNFELILVNDGSTDDSKKIIDSYKDKRIIRINQENMGVSDARNKGIKKATGDYLVFIDSDDYVEKDLLSNINKSISDEDVFRYQIRRIYNNGNISDYHEEEFTKLIGKDAFRKIVNYHYVEIACSYIIKRDYFMKNNFSFVCGKLHEDYGLIPLVIIKANLVSSISYIGYNYVESNDSITSFTSYEKEYTKAKDVLWHFNNLVFKDGDKYYQSFLANEALLKAKYLNKQDYKKYINDLKKYNVVNYLLEDTLKRKIKKYLLKININLIKFL